MARTPEQLKTEILKLTREYSRQVHGHLRPAFDQSFIPWKEGDPIPMRAEFLPKMRLRLRSKARLIFG